MASRIAWSSALRRPGLEMVSRRTPSAGRSRVTSPLMAPKSTVARRAGPCRLLEHDERVALVDRLALLAQDLPDDARVLGLDRRLHLHRLEDHDGVALPDRLADLALDLPDRARDVGLDLRHAVLLRDIRPSPGTARQTIPAPVDGARAGPAAPVGVPCPP